MEPTLREKYPALFRTSEPRNPIAMFGIECSRGWRPIIDRLCADLIELSEREKVAPPIIQQIKEKFGTLRVYADNATPTMAERISEAQIESASVCERCGQPGQLDRINGWFITLCEQHAAERRRR